MTSKLIADLIRIHNDPKFKLGWIEQTILAEACAALAAKPEPAPEPYSEAWWRSAPVVADLAKGGVGVVGAEPVSDRLGTPASGVPAEPVAWRFKFDPDSEWRHVAYRPQGPVFREEPLFVHPITPSSPPSSTGRQTPLAPSALQGSEK